MELSYISGNQNPKKLLIFHEIMLWARKIIIKKKNMLKKIIFREMKLSKTPLVALKNIFSKLLSHNWSLKLPPQKYNCKILFWKICSLKKCMSEICFKKVAPTKLNLQSLKIKNILYFFSHFLFVERELFKSKGKRKKFLPLSHIKKQNFLN